jgi:hypothetical protein
MTNHMVQAASYPPLQKTQGRGTHSSGTGTENSEGWATRPKQFIDHSENFIAGQLNGWGFEVLPFLPASPKNPSG